MASLQSIQPLIDDFYQAINQRQLLRAEALLHQLCTQVKAQPELELWCLHYTAVLLTEHQQDWAQAERMFTQLLMEPAPLEPLLKGKTLFELGICLHYQGRWLDSIRVCEESLPLLAAVGELSDQAFVYKQIAINYRYGFLNGELSSNALEQAMTNCRQALALLAKVENPPPYVVNFQGVMTNLLGELHLDLEQWEDAIGCFESYLHLCQTLNDEYGVSVAYSNLGEVYERLGNAYWLEAKMAYQKAWSVLQKVEGGHTQKIEILTRLGYIHQTMQEFATARDYYDQTIDIIESIRASASSELVRTGFFGITAQIYVQKAFVCLALNQTAEAFNSVERARARAFLDLLASDSTELVSKFATQALTLTEIQAKLPPDTLLLCYFTTGLIEVHEGRKQRSQQPKRYRFPPAKTLIFAVSRDSLHFFDAALSPNDLQPRELHSLIERHFLEPMIRRQLYNKLIQPVAHLLQGKRRVYLVPHGPLHYVPFQTLLAPDGDTLLRRSGPELVYAPSASLLFGSLRSYPAASTRTLLTIGDNGTDHIRLRFAEAEARLLAQMMDGTAVIGPLAKPTLLSSQASEYKLLHFACHSTFDPAHPLHSKLHMAPGETITAQEILEQVKLRCDLVTLSACESGLNRVRRGDELYGLLRAFMIAGARAVLAGLWRVDDRSTLLLMVKFYQAMQQRGGDFASALHQAQVYLKELTRDRAVADLAAIGIQLSAPELPGDQDEVYVFADPKYWAPFVLIGEPALSRDPVRSQ